MGGACDQISGKRVETGEVGERLDGPLQALARSDQAPGEHERSLAGHQRRSSEHGIRSMGDHFHEIRIDVIPLLQAIGPGLTHDDQSIGVTCESVDDEPLIPARVLEDGVERDRHRDAQARNEIRHFFAVGATEDPELVLDRDGVVSVQDTRCDFERATIADPVVIRDIRSSAWAPIVSDVDHAKAGAGAAIMGDGVYQRCREAGKTAHGRRVRADEADGWCVRDKSDVILR